MSFVGGSPFSNHMPNGSQSQVGTQAIVNGNPSQQIGVMEIGPSSTPVPNFRREAEPAYLNGKVIIPMHVK